MFKLDPVRCGYAAALALTAIAMSSQDGAEFVPIAMLLGIIILPVWALIVHGGSDRKGGSHD